MKTKLQKWMFALFAVMVATSVNAQTTTINYTAKQKIVTPCLSPCDPMRFSLTCPIPFLQRHSQRKR